MKTRIVFTKIHEDDYFRSLSDREQCFFFFLLTNERVNLSGMYHCPDWYVLGVKPHWTQKSLDEMKQKFMRDGKFAFINGWVKILNYTKYNQYAGSKLDKALESELATVPNEVKECNVDTLSTEYRYPIDTTNNNKSITINNKSITENLEKKKKEEITPEQIKALAEKLEISPEGVMNWYQRIKDHEASKGVKYKDYPATIRVWVGRERDKGGIQL